MDENVVAVVDSSDCSKFGFAGIPSRSYMPTETQAMPPPYTSVYIPFIRYPPYPPSVPTAPYKEEP
jgi:hypothetical protein